jgi:hypothetical protein
LGTISAFAFRHRETKRDGNQETQGNQERWKTRDTGKPREMETKRHRETKRDGNQETQGNQVFMKFKNM